MNIKDGLKIEHAAAVTLRDAIRQHMATFAFVIRTDRRCGQDIVAAYVDGLAGAVALTIAGGHGSKEEVVNATVRKLREAVDRDLQHLGKNDVKN
jgi:hypothetical protein